MFSIFKRKPCTAVAIIEPVELTPIPNVRADGLAVGQVWRRDQPDPFREPLVVRIEDIRGAYVQYRYWFQDMRKWASSPTSNDINAFLSIYRRES